MNTFGLFNDLPQIRLDEDELCNQNPAWPVFSDDSAIRTDDGYSYSRSIILGGTRLIVDLNNPEEMPMQRFMLDRPPYAPGFHHNGFKSDDGHLGMFNRPDFNRPYENQFPDSCFQRQGSPAETSRSFSSAGSQSACYSDELRRLDYSPRGSYCAMHDQDSQGVSFPAFASLSVSSPVMPPGGGSGIALRDIQHFSDAEPEESIEEYGVIDQHDDSISYDEEHITCRPKFESQDHHYCESHEDEGLGHSIRDGESVQPCSPDEETQDSDYKPSSPSSRVVKRRKRRSSQSSTDHAAKSASKRSAHKRKSSGTPMSRNGISKAKRNSVGNESVTTARPFPCPLAGYGCQSTFTSKNEWKRHVSTQHVRLGYWRCDMCPQPPDADNGGWNDFNRKDLFTQHLRRMHVKNLIASSTQTSQSNKNEPAKQPVISEDSINATQTRCYRELRRTPLRSGCLFCDQTFTGTGSWDERMEHVGAHFERDRKNGKAMSTDSWREDVELKGWLIDEGLIQEEERGSWTIGDGIPLRNMAR